MRKKILLLMSVSISGFLSAQNLDIGISYGRLYAIYQYKDFGNGFKNLPGSQYSPFPSIVLSKIFSKTKSVELKLSFISYEQYTGTRLYTPGFVSNFNTGNIALTYNFSILQNPKLDVKIKGGIGLGLAPDLYSGSFVEMHVYPFVDSISRGNIKRDFTPIFPMLSTGIDFSYKIAKRIKFCIDVTYQKGFLKITEYDIYYNNGNGSNDQQARQWGTGDFYGIQFGIRYILQNIVKEKPGRKTKNN